MEFLSWYGSATFGSILGILISVSWSQIFMGINKMFGQEISKMLWHKDSEVFLTWDQPRLKAA
jgi:hypothetical protein